MEELTWREGVNLEEASLLYVHLCLLFKEHGRGGTLLTNRLLGSAFFLPFLVVFLRAF